MRFAIQDGKLVTPDNVDKQKYCNCPVCNKVLAVHENHFQHLEGTCNSSDTTLVSTYIMNYIKAEKKAIFVRKYPESSIETLADYSPIKSPVKNSRADLVMTNGDFTYYIYIHRNALSRIKEDEKYFENETDYRIFAVNPLKFIKKYDSVEVNKENSVRYFINIMFTVNDTKFYKISSFIGEPYGKCGECDVPMELCINTYNDDSKPVANISTEYIRDDRMEDKSKQARFDVGALVLRCPKCHKIMTVKCPTCLSRGKVRDMKLLINYKRQHIYACCSNYCSFTDMVNGTNRVDKEDVCDTSLILYSDVNAKVISEEQKKVGGFFKWLNRGGITE